MPAWLAQNTTGYVLDVVIAPRASKNRIIGEYNGALKIAVTSPPVDGEANEAVIKFLSKLLGVPKSSIEILSGSTSKKKKIQLPSQASIQKLSLY